MLFFLTKKRGIHMILWDLTAIDGDHPQETGIQRLDPRQLNRLSHGWDRLAGSPSDGPMEST